MSEKIYDCDWNEQKARKHGKRYAYTTHPETRHNCYRQYCEKREAQADKDHAEHLASIAAPKPETLEEKVHRLVAEALAKAGK